MAVGPGGDAAESLRLKAAVVAELGRRAKAVEDIEAGRSEAKRLLWAAISEARPLLSLRALSAATGVSVSYLRRRLAPPEPPEPLAEPEPAPVPPAEPEPAPVPPAEPERAPEPEPAPEPPAPPPEPAPEPPAPPPERAPEPEPSGPWPPQYAPDWQPPDTPSRDWGPP